MAGNNSIQILRGSQTYDTKTSDQILLDGQPFYSKKTTEFFIGDGESAIKNLKPVKALTDQSYSSTSDTAQKTVQARFHPTRLRYMFYTHAQVGVRMYQLQYMYA